VAQPQESETAEGGSFEYENKIWRSLGLEDEKCPYCGSHLKLVDKPSYEGGVGMPICLNACHLGKAGQERFNARMREVMENLDEHS
jgi:hypothetical protein